jgi:hypothetical protein
MKLQPPLDLATLPVTFTVGEHSVVVARQERRWTLSVDGAASTATYPTEAEAWEAGVRLADQLDRCATR